MDGEMVYFDNSEREIVNIETQQQISFSATLQEFPNLSLKNPQRYDLP
jgi:hypothetical protein